MRLNLTQNGLPDLEARLDGLEKACTGIAKQCLYEGAKVVADNLRAAIMTIPTEEHHAVPNARNGKQLVYMTPEEKKEVLNGIGIADFDGTDDYFTTAISFNGYMNEDEDGQVTTKRHPYGIPIAMIMYSLESGSSVRQKYPVCRKTFTASKNAAIAAMQAKFNELIKKTE